MEVGKPGLKHVRVASSTTWSANAKIDAGLAATLHLNPNAIVNGMISAKVSAAALTAWVGVPGFVVNAIAGDIHTFHDATKAIIERLAAHPDVVSIEGAAKLQPEQQRPGDIAGWSANPTEPHRNQ